MQNDFYLLAKSKIKFNLFLFTKLPAAFFSGVKIKELNEKKAVCTIRYKWFATNPFRSTYFACLAMCAEMSTGLLAMAHIYEQQPQVSMLVQKMEANYYKKAIGTTYFTCEDGLEFADKIAQTKLDGSPQLIKAKAIGTDKDGTIIADFVITWALKRK